MSGQTSKKIGRYLGVKGPAVSEVVRGIEGRWDEEIQLRKEMESLRGEEIIKF